MTGVIVLTLYLQGLPKTWILSLDSTVSCVIELNFLSLDTASESCVITLVLH